MPIQPSSSAIPLPSGWTSHVKSAVLQVISLAQFSLAYSRGWAANSPNSRLQLKAELDRAQQEVALLREEQRIKDARMQQLSPHHRPYYPPQERMAILELKAARHWSLAETARAFLVTAETISAWMQRIDEQGPEALVQTHQPVNRYPDFVTYMVQVLKKLCPAMGKKKLTQVLARAGLHLGTTSIGRMLKRKPGRFPSATNSQTDSDGRIVTANYAGHVWHVDLTLIPTGRFWAPWLPFSLPQRWPFAWWAGVIEDHFSRRIMGITAFNSEPSSEAMRAFLGHTKAKARKGPRYIVCDRGKQFDCEAFRQWCQRKGVKKLRYGAIGKTGSIAVVERAILTIKCPLSGLWVSYRREAFLR